jgi:hypothetical protein
MGRADDDLDFLDLPPKRTAREWQALARSENYSVTRINGDGTTAKRKCNPDRMRRICAQLAQVPVAKDACEMNGVTTHSVKLWLTKSRLGQPGDGFDIIVNPDDDPEDQTSVRFHELYDASLKEGAQNLLRATWKRAMGYREPLTYQGRVIYKLDPLKLRLGMEGMDAYLLDEEGYPVPESVEKQDPDLMQFLLKGLMPETFGNKTKIEMEGKISGVLVVAAKAATGQAIEEEEALYRKAPMQVTFEEDDESDVG